MRTVTIDEKSPYLGDVLALARANSATLGFLPRAAFIESTRDRQLLVATDKDGRFLGYLLYGISGKKMLAYIKHLCILPQYRKSKVATSLVDELRSQTSETLRGIRVRCRRDFEASKVWPILGFSAIVEIPGRGKKETTLTVWWLDYGHHTLFTFVDNLNDPPKLRVTLDANVVFKLNEPTSAQYEECKALLADWLSELIELCVTNELFNEINRHPDKVVRAFGRNFAHKFRIVSGNQDQFQAARQVLRPLFPIRLTTSDESDIRQIARSIASGIQFFVTLDPRLLKLTDEIFEQLGIRILRPADLILSQDTLIREAEYQPVRFAGASMAIERARPMEQPLLSNTFRAPQGETKQGFTGLLNSLLADPTTIEVKVVKEADRPRALLALRRSDKDELQVPILRIDRSLSSGMSSTLSRYLIQELTLTATKEERPITRITDQYLPPDSDEALRENGFSQSNSTWIKINIGGVMSVDELLAKLSDYDSEIPWARMNLQRAATILESQLQGTRSDMLLGVEKALWPVKIKETNIPNFIVPIRPEWAMHLFDTDIGSQNLFGGNPHLIFRVENAYYRSSSPRVLTAPGRILWYVSKHSGKYQGTEAIRACSYLDDVVIDEPKRLFTRFRRLGVYKWDDLYKLSNRNLEKKIMGFRFTKTEMLPHPIHKTELQRIWQEQKGKNFHIQSPIRIPTNMFFNLYSSALKSESMI